MEVPQVWDFQDGHRWKYSKCGAFRKDIGWSSPGVDAPLCLKIVSSVQQNG